MNTLRFTPLLVFAILLLAGCNGQVTRDQELLLSRGEEDYRAKRYTQASDSLSRFIQQVRSDQPGYGRALYLRGMAYANNNQRQAAYRDLEECVRIAASEEIVWKAYVSLGTLRFEDNRWQQAAVAYRAAADRMPNSSPKDTVLFRLAESYERSGQWTKARIPLQELIDSFPGTNYAREARVKINRSQATATVRGSTPQPRKTVQPSPAQPIPTARQFAVQAGVFGVKSNADRMVQQLRARNLPAMVQREVVQRQARYVVLVGPYPRYQDAQRMLGTVKQTVPDAVMWP